MKKTLPVVLAAALSISLVGCGGGTTSAGQAGSPAPLSSAVQSEAPSSVTITSLNGNKEPVELEVPYNPQRIAFWTWLLWIFWMLWGLGIGW